jgi:hypothetical protein
MAYDANDKADKKIVADLIAAALAEAAEEHAADVTGLKNKNSELILTNKKLREGKGDPLEVERLEAQVEALSAESAKAVRAVKKLEGERDGFKTQAESETKASHKLLIDGGLTDVLLANNVGKEFLPAVKAMLAGQVTVKADGENRTAVVGDKPLGDFIKEWAQGADAKIYVKAPANGGGNAPGGQAKGTEGGNTITRDAFDGLGQTERAKFAMAGGQVVDAS